MTRLIAVAILAILVATTSGARAEAPDRTNYALEQLARTSLIDRTWPLPTLPDPKVTPPAAVRMIELGDAMIAPVGALSFDLVSLRLDARTRMLRLRIGNDSPRYAQVRLSGDISIFDGVARMDARLRLGLGQQGITVPLPVVEVAPASYREERGVEVRLPLLHTLF